MHKAIIATLAILLFASICNAQYYDCPDCGSKYATGVPENKKVKKKVYNVECKDIAVPDICLPRPLFCLREQLSKLRQPKCIPGDPCGTSCGNVGCTCEPVRHGFVRTIKVLKKKTVECDRCSYKWEVIDPCKWAEPDHSMDEFEEVPANKAEEKKGADAQNEKLELRDNNNSAQPRVPAQQNELPSPQAPAKPGGSPKSGNDAVLFRFSDQLFAPQQPRQAQANRYQYKARPAPRRYR